MCKKKIESYFIRKSTVSFSFFLVHAFREEHTWGCGLVDVYLFQPLVFNPSAILHHFQPRPPLLRLSFLIDVFSDCDGVMGKSFDKQWKAGGGGEEGGGASLCAASAKIPQTFSSLCTDPVWLCSVVLLKMNDSLLKTIIDWMCGRGRGSDRPPVYRSHRGPFRGLNVITPPPSLPPSPPLWIW